MANFPIVILLNQKMFYQYGGLAEAIPLGGVLAKGCGAIRSECRFSAAIRIKKYLMDTEHHTYIKCIPDLI